MRIVSARQMQELDRETIDKVGIPGIVLMENAGRGVYEKIKRHFPGVKKRIVVICGRGNNGGDGFVIARCFHNDGYDVKVYLLSTPDKVSGDARLNLNAFQRTGGHISMIADEAQWRGIGSDIEHAGLIVDAILGTGLSSDVKGLYKLAIESINAKVSAPVVSVDIPSGIDATTGKILGTAIKADMTCTFGLLKIGLAIYPGLSHAGTIEVIDIGIPSSILEKDDLQEYLLDESFFRGIILRRDPESHKGTYGHLLIIAGSPGKTGAAAMAAEAAMRAGAGLVTLGIPETLNSVLETKLTEVMTAPLPDKGDGFLDVDSWRAIHDMLDGKTAIAIGPGLSDRDETAGLVYRVLEEAKVPLIVDADALNAISKNTGILRKLKAQTILTPHPGEMARLLGVSTQKIQEDRVETARQFSKEFGVIVVLKGARTIIAEPGGKIFINSTGNPGMASGGMGDVLTGLISGLAAQGFSPLLASQVSVFSHGLIGDLIAGERAGIGIMATDIIERIPETLEKYFMSPKKQYANQN